MPIEDEDEDEAPELPFYLQPVWAGFIKLGSEFSYETELVPYLNRVCGNDRDMWLWYETLFLTLRAQVSKWNSDNLKNRKKESLNKSSSKTPKKEKPKGIGKGHKGKTERFEGIEGIRRYQQQFEGG